MAIPNKPSKKRKRTALTPEVCEIIRERLKKGDLQHDIAADLGQNQGRISEVKTGKRGSKSQQLSLF